MTLVTITGASGFVGQNLSKYLTNEGMHVLPLSLRHTNWNSHFNKQSTAVIHLAGKAHDTNNSTTPEDYFKINRDLTIELFNEFLNSEIHDFFFFSSVKAIADSTNDVLSEDAIPNPRTPYGKSKCEAEGYLLKQTLPKGKRLFIIRPCMIHGLGNKGNLNLLYKVVEARVPWFLASFENNRSFLSIDNLSFLIVAMLQNKNVSSGIYHFADDTPVSTNTLISLITETMGRKPMLWYINKFMLSGIAAFGDKTRLPINSERLKKLTESYVVSNQKIKSALGIEKLPLTTEEGLRLTIESFKQNRA